MILIIIVLSGISGTAFMTLFLYLLTPLIHRQVKVVKILGTILANKTTPHGDVSNIPFVIWIGMVTHYLIGIMFAFCYYLLWQRGIGNPSLTSGIFFGFCTGLVGITVWRIVFYIHPRPPETVSLPVFLLSLLAAHIIFGACTNLTYTSLLQLI